MELRHLRYFVAVAEELHFGRAAARLHIAQPPLSQQIQAFERELGVTLFNRSRRHVELTDAGRMLLPEARATLAQAERAEEMARAAAAGTRGRLVVGFVTSSGYTVLPRAVRRFRAAHPGIELVLHDMIPARQLEALERGEIDIGLMRPPILHPDMHHVPVLEEPMVAALPHDHRLVRRRWIHLRELQPDPFILFPRRHGPGLYDVITAACREAGFTCSPAYEPNDMPSVLAHVAAGLGVSIVPESMVAFHTELIVYRRIRTPAMQVALELVWPRQRLSTAATAFRDIAASVGRGCRTFLEQRTAPS